MFTFMSAFLIEPDLKNKKYGCNNHRNPPVSGSLPVPRCVSRLSRRLQCTYIRPKQLAHISKSQPFTFNRPSQSIRKRPIVHGLFLI